MTESIYARGIKRGTFSDGRHRLFVAFAREHGLPEFQWTPAWLAAGHGVADLLREAVRVERSNRPGSAYLREFAELARDILVEHAPPSEVRRESGIFVRYLADGTNQPSVEVQVREWTGTRFWEHGRETWPLGVALSDPSLRRIAAAEDLQLVIWNGEVIDIHGSRGSLI